MSGMTHSGDTSPPARRSCLSVPASAPGKLAKARDLGADEVVVDLEDSVAVAVKHEALAALERGVQADNAGAVALDGEMLDEAVRRSAIRILTRSAAAGERR
jgi:citrate lyase beta subunit